MTKLTDKIKNKFLSELAQAQSVSCAARTTGVSRTAYYKLREADHVFKRNWQDALEQGVDALEDEAVRRALQGSDTLLIFLLKGAKPDKYRDNVHVQQEVSGEVTLTWSDRLSRAHTALEERRNGHALPA